MSLPLTYAVLVAGRATFPMGVYGPRVERSRNKSILA